MSPSPAGSIRPTIRPLVNPANQQTFTDLARQALHELRAATATLD
jgi:hypothetical protein